MRTFFSIGAMWQRHLAGGDARDQVGDPMEGMTKNHLHIEKGEPVLFSGRIPRRARRGKRTPGRGERRGKTEKKERRKGTFLITGVKGNLSCENGSFERAEDPLEGGERNAIFSSLSGGEDLPRRKSGERIEGTLSRHDYRLRKRAEIRGSVKPEEGTFSFLRIRRRKTRRSEESGQGKERRISEGEDYPPWEGDFRSVTKTGKQRGRRPRAGDL